MTTQTGHIDLKVEGMHCSNCALTISNYLKKQGLKDVNVDPINGDVSFTSVEVFDEDKIKKGIKSLGYKVTDEIHDAHHGHEHGHEGSGFLQTNKSRFLFSLPFTAILMLHMLEKWVSLHWLMNPWVQLALCLPVFILGMWFFGKSAVKSVLNGMPNMNVLVALGSAAAFVYSVYGTFMLQDKNYMFFETAASIITLVFLGNYLEETSVKRTQREVKKLTQSQKTMANMIAFDDKHQEQVFTVESSDLRTGDLILIKTGEQVPADCKILWGECTVSEAIITGESAPVFKQKKDILIGGSIIENGTVKAQVTAAGNETVLSGIIDMVKHAQGEKPPMQKLADRISAVFVPAVIVIAAATFLISHFAFDVATAKSLMRAIAVLVISCPCAMGLATPAAIAVGLGRGAKNGILYKNASAMEKFKTIKQVVFDKTGTLTTGEFQVSGFYHDIDEAAFKKIAYSLEKYSTHPVATCVAKEFKTGNELHWKKIEEIKGLGMRAEDNDGNIFEAGSYKLLDEKSTDNIHNVYILKNRNLLGWIDVADEIRPEAADVIKWLHDKKIKTVLLSGDKKEKCDTVAQKLTIDVVIAEQTPEQKLIKIDELNKRIPTAMVGDGINDAPALAKASLGISLSGAAHIAMQSADVILLNQGLKNLPYALGLGRHTDATIKQNLFWAFLYNIVAIPIAAMGLLTPTVSALSMGFSDVVLGVNSLRLFTKKVF